MCFVFVCLFILKCLALQVVLICRGLIVFFQAGTCGCGVACLDFGFQSVCTLCVRWGLLN